MGKWQSPGIKPKYTAPKPLVLSVQYLPAVNHRNRVDVKNSPDGQTGSSPHCSMGKISFMLSLPSPKPYCCGCGSFSCYLIQHGLLNVCFLLLAHCMLRNRLRFPACVCLASYTWQPSVPLEVNGMFPQSVPCFLFYKGNQTR